MLRFNITLPPRSCFGEIGETLVYGLGAAGYEASATDYLDTEATNILLGAYLAPPEIIPDDTIIYNFEQVGAFRFPLGFMDVARRCIMWDYSRRNVEAWKQFGVNAVHVPLGYMPQLSRIQPAVTQDVDVLFYGILNEHRRAILEQIARRGLKLRVLVASVANRLRDDLISRAKVVLNLHFYDTRIFEIARVSYLLANSKCVVSEHSADEDEYEYLKGGILLSSPEGIADICQSLVHNKDRRQRWERAGFERFSANNEALILKPVVESLACHATACA